MKVIAIVQARTGSSRFPGKVLAPLGTRTLIEVLVQRLRKARRLDGVLVATTTARQDDQLAKLLRARNIPFYRGSQNDVLARYSQAARRSGADAVVRITGDCPLVDGVLVDTVVEDFQKGGADYVSNIDPPTFPDGLDVEAFSIWALEEANRKARTAQEREHITQYLRKKSSFKKRNITNPQDLSKERWTVDEPADLVVVRQIFQSFAPRTDFAWKEVMKLKQRLPAIFEGNSKITRNEGIGLGSGQKLWKRAKHVIPGGNMLLSKRSEMFLPDHWPAYFSRAKGCHVWDLDGKRYVDMSIMGIGTNILGYGHPAVDEAVRQVVRKGNMSTLNCPEEVYLAEKLIELHPWAEMVRLARTGGEANAIAIRIARAASGKEKVAVCGYHGWHDWYLSANIADDHNLDGHLLPGLEPRGVPRHLKGTVFPFRYNQYEELESLVKRECIGIVKMEVERNEPPRPGYLQKIRKLCSDRGVILIFDECTSGFRETFGGLHKKYGVDPDMAMFGKALGNGYAITAVIGRREIMEAAQSTFISSTFWGERIGPAAAMKTLEVMSKERSWQRITAVGKRITRDWFRIAKVHGLKIKVFGLPALAGFAFEEPNHAIYKTLLAQEMLKKGFLASTAVYASCAHSPEILHAYAASLDRVFAKISRCEKGLDPRAILEGPVVGEGFRRLN